MRSLGVVLLVCLAVRLCWVLVEPVLAPLGVLVVLVAILYLLFASPRFRG